MKKIIKILSVVALSLALNVGNVFALGTTVKVFFDKDSYLPGESVGITVQYYNSEPALVQMSFSSDNITLNNSSTRASTAWEKEGSFRFTGVAGKEGQASVTAKVVELVNQKDEVVSGQIGSGKVLVKAKEEKPATNPAPQPTEPEKKREEKPATQPEPQPQGTDVSVAPPEPQQKPEKQIENPIRKIETPHTPSSAAYLSGFTTMDGEISPKFNLKEDNYTLKLKPGINTASIVVMPLHPKATVDHQSLSGNAGETLTFTVTAENGDKKVYTVKIVKEESKATKIKALINGAEKELEANAYTNSKVFPKGSFAPEGGEVMDTAIYKTTPILWVRDKDAEAQLNYFDPITKELSPYVELDIPSGRYAIAPKWDNSNEKDLFGLKIANLNVNGRNVKVYADSKEKSKYVLRVIDPKGQVKFLSYNADRHSYAEWKPAPKQAQQPLWEDWIFWSFVGVTLVLLVILGYTLWRLYEESKPKKSV